MSANQSFTGANTYTGGVTFSSTVTGAYNISFTSSSADSTYSNNIYLPVAGSTTTITVNSGKRVRLSFTASVSADNANQGCMIRAMNGGVALATDSTSNCEANSPSANEIETCAFNYITAAMAAGIQTFSLMARDTDTNVCTIEGANSAWHFIAEEIR